MRHVTGVLVRGTVGALLTTALLSGCGGGGSDDPPESKGSSKDDLIEMHEALDEVGDLIDAAGDGAGDYQGVVNGVREKDPAAVLTDPTIDAALAEQQEREDARDEAITELGEMPGMDDPDVASAYQEFATAAEKMFAFQDGYNASMPEFLRALDVCVKIFDVKVDLGPLMALPGAYQTEWLAQHRKLTKPCEARLDPLADSGNYRIREYVESTHRLIAERNNAMSDIGYTDASMDKALKALKHANESYVARQKKITAFSDELGKISAVDEYQALHAVFEDKLGLVEGDAAPSESPSGSPSSS
ncbi:MULTISPECIES: hypothetical protein [unclassified Nocardioides]|uniref:hypothetical protein n=1 Tax=unclassified Nocardioides TaxID=2615069 RepID=UPI000A26E7A1|nr:MULTISPECIES: hypothetical protein [unclassified Nocardioides]